MADFRLRGNAREFERKLREAMRRAQGAPELAEQFLSMTELAVNEFPAWKAEFPENFN